MTESDKPAEQETGDPDHLPSLSATTRTRHRRLQEQGRTRRGELYSVLRAGLVAHMGVLSADAPMVVPTSYGFDAEMLYVHGSVASQSLRTDGVSPICVTITLVDGLVLARSVFDHGVNYRSAMIYGVPRLVTDAQEKMYGLRLLSEQIAPGQWDYARQPLRKELAATALLALRLDEASVKIRSGPPDDAASPDAPPGIWAGVLPLACSWGEPAPAPEIPEGTPVPAHIAARAGRPAFAAEQAAPPGGGPASALRRR